MTIGYTVIVWFLCLLALGEPVSADLLAPFGITVSIVTLSTIIFVKFIWKIPVLQRWLIERPFLGGTWKARLVSTYQFEGKPVEKIVYVVIRQSLTELSFRLYTEKARSASLAEAVTPDGSDLYRLAVSYQNIPNVEYRGVDSEIHYGAALFEHIDFGATKIEGHYWTDRNTSGSLVLFERSPKTVSNFADAVALFST